MLTRNLSSQRKISRQFIGAAIFLLLGYCIGYAQDASVKPLPDVILDESIAPEADPAEEGAALSASGLDRVRELQMERVRALEEAAGLLDVEFGLDGNVLMGDVLKVHEELWNARLELCLTKADRVKACEQLVKTAETMYRNAEVQSREGLRKPSDALLAKARFLKAQIELERARALTEATK